MIACLKNGLKFIYHYLKYKKNISLKQYIRYNNFLRAKYTGKAHALKIKNLKAPFFCRPGSSDMSIVLSFLLENKYAKTIPGAIHIIDAGANIGAATVLFKQRYPDAKIIAIEPDDKNYNILKKNTDHLSGIMLYKGGLTSTSGKFLTIPNPNAASYSFQVEYADHGIPSYSINGLMKDMGWQTIDIVKIDIEGGEKELFEKNTQWINVTKQIIIELHDYKIEGCSNCLINALQGHDFNISFYGENLILTNNNMVNKVS